MTMMKLKLPDLLMGGDLEKTASRRGWRSLWIYSATGGGVGKEVAGWGSARQRDV
jgi:hypothetical protein